MNALNRKILLSLMLTLGAFTALTAIGVRGFEGLMASSARVQHMHRVMARLESGLRQITVAQSSQREFLQTADSAFLELCQAALFSLDEDLRRIRKLFRDPDLSVRIDALDPLLVQQVEFSKESFRVRDERGPRAAARLIRAQGAEASLKRLFDQATELLAFETRLLEAQSAELAGRFMRLRQGLLFGAAAALLLALLLVTVVHREMARRGDAELALSRERQLLRLVMDGMDEAALVFSADGRLASFNPAAQRYFGKELIDLPLGLWPGKAGILHSDEQTPYAWDELAVARALRGVPSDDHEIFLRTPSQTQGLHLSLNGRPLTDARGVLTGALVVCRDISHFSTALRSSPKAA